MAVNAKGRGTAANPKGRFEAHSIHQVDDGWDAPIDPVVRTDVRIERPRKVITRNTSPDVPFDRSVNPYRGCEHGCIYCFARPTHSYLGLSPGLDFETQLIARPGTAEQLAKELSAKSYTPKPIAFGTNTDPYQPIEREWQVMADCLDVLSAFHHPLTITTKGSLIERDLPILANLAERNLVQVGISITTLNSKLSRQLEPRVPGPKRRLQMIERLADHNIPVRVCTSPTIPGLTDHELESILQAGKDAGAQAASWIMLRLPFEVSELFQEWLLDHMPDRASKVMARIREVHGGKDYDPKWGKRMRGEGVYAALVSQRFDLARHRLGLAASLPQLDVSQFRVPPRAGDQLALF